MKFEFFTESGRGYEPRASIRKQGQIGLNHGSVKRYEIRDGQDVLLGYDRQSSTVAIKFIDGPQQGSKKAMVKKNNCSISAKAFFDYFDIQYKDKTESYELKSKEDGLLVFCIDEGGVEEPGVEGDIDDEAGG